VSELLVSVVKINDIKPHPNADRLEIACIDGWEIISGVGNYKPGDLVVHVPPEAMVLKEYADEWGVTPYLSFKANARAGRVKAARLRGVVSFGFLVPAPDGAEIGTDLREVFEIEKYEPPERSLGAGQMSNEDPLFFRYTNIQNLRNEVSAFDPDLGHVVTEKIHGTNSRVGWIRNDEGELVLACGSHKRQVEVEESGLYGEPIRQYSDELNRLRDLISATAEKPGVLEINSIIVYGEIYGPGVQDLHYGVGNNTKGYRVFDVSVNGEYLPWNLMFQLCHEAGLETVPILAHGKFTLQEVFDLAEGETTLGEAKQIREGIVIRPLHEERPHRNGRYIFKVISGGYLSRKDGTELH
jgi:RNA ligase (TIGR02306 family)